MMVFIDIGAFHGDRAQEALDLDIFEEIHCYEPSLEACEELTRRFPTGVEIHPYGLWNKKGKFLLNYCGSSGASLFKDKECFSDYTYGPTKGCHFERAVVELNLFPSDTRFVIKLNCEGAECDILEDLFLDYHLMERIVCFGIDFDACKIPSKQHMPQNAIRKLKEFRIPFAETTSYKGNRVKILSKLFTRNV